MRTATRRCVHMYRTEMENFAQMHFLDVWYSRIDVDQVSQLFDAVQSKKAVRRRHGMCGGPTGTPACRPWGSSATW